MDRSVNKLLKSCGGCGACGPCILFGRMVEREFHYGHELQKAKRRKDQKRIDLFSSALKEVEAQQFKIQFR